MWSGNASGISFPSNSGITIGGSSPIQLLVLQVHYINNSNIDPIMGDSSGEFIKYYHHIFQLICLFVIYVLCMRAQVCVPVSVCEF